MGSKKLRLYSTETDNLISNLRGEVGEVVSAWVLARGLMAQAASLRSGDPTEEMEDRGIRTLDVLINKLTDEIIARLSELAEPKIGRLNFYFAHRKLDALDAEVKCFHRFVEKSRIKEKRNHDISHKQLPERWSDHKEFRIPYPVVVKGVAHALGLMKKIDDAFLGPSARYLWREMRKRRYTPMYPASAGYMLLPHLRLSSQDRLNIVSEEAATGQAILEDIVTCVNGKPTTVRASRKWGILLLDDRMLALDNYPLVELADIHISEVDTANVDAARTEGDSAGGR